MLHTFGKKTKDSLTRSYNTLPLKPYPCLHRAILEKKKEEKRKMSEIKRRRVVIENSHGEKLVGILHDADPKRIVIICHGFQSCKDRIPMVTLASVFEREGISAFRFDFAGNGDSEGSFQYGNYRREAEDLRSVVQHFHRESRAISAIIGHSKGGNAVLLYGSKYNDVPIIVNISGRFFLENGIEGRLGKDYFQRIKQNGFIDVRNRKGKFEYRVTEESLINRLTTDTRAACLSIHENCRVLTVHGSRDKIVAATEAEEFAKLIRNHKLTVVEGADHEFTWHQEELSSIVLEFVKTGLQMGKEHDQKIGTTVNTISSRM